MEKPKKFFYNYAVEDEDYIIDFINYLKTKFPYGWVTSLEDEDEDSCFIVNFFSKQAFLNNDFLNQLQNFREFECVNVILDRSNILHGIHYQSQNYEKTAEEIFAYFRLNEEPKKVEEEPQVLKKPHQDIDPERMRLMAQNFALKKESRKILKDIINDDSAILDLGCGDASSIKMRLEGILYGAYYGIDKDQHLIDIANKKNENYKNRFRCCDIERDLNLALGGKRFDVIILSSILYQLEDPVSLLRNLRTYLKPEGYLFIQEMDDSLNRFYPERTIFKNGLKLWENLELGGDRHCGLKVQQYLEEAGYNYIYKRLEGINAASLEEPKYLWDSYFNYHLWKPLTTDDEEVLETYKNYKLAYKYNHEDFVNGVVGIELGFIFYLVRPNS